MQDPERFLALQRDVVAADRCVPRPVEIETQDREALAAALRADADGWFQAVAAHHDSTRICGHAPLYALLRCAEPGAGELLRYERSDEPDTSFVTIASMSWPAAG